MIERFYSKNTHILSLDHTTGTFEKITDILEYFNNGKVHRGTYVCLDEHKMIELLFHDTKKSIVNSWLTCMDNWLPFNKLKNFHNNVSIIDVVKSLREDYHLTSYNTAVLLSEIKVNNAGIYIIDDKNNQHLSILHTRDNRSYTLMFKKFPINGIVYFWNRQNKYPYILGTVGYKLDPLHLTPDDKTKPIRNESDITLITLDNIHVNNELSDDAINKMGELSAK
jgi:hypothetical protein